MITEDEQTLDPRRQHAVTELTELVRQRYPTASFEIGPGEDDSEATRITATVDLDDPDERRQGWNTNRLVGLRSVSG
jgi:hypothetical protein